MSVIVWQEKQRVTSRSEPELGIGIVVECSPNLDRLLVEFPASSLVRSYTIRTAPIVRFVLKEGDHFWGTDESKYQVRAVMGNASELLQYRCDDQTFWEWEIGSRPPDNQSQAVQAFLARQLSPPTAYDLRKEAWQIRSRSTSDNVRGLVGPRVVPLAHQLYIAAQVARRMHPRVVLADEVGLGKTIEAALIFSALRALGKADRVLILVPESLVNQWVAEMYRRFGEVFSILDEGRCSEEESSLGVSPFVSCRRAITTLEFFLEHEDRFAQALESEYDLMIVDEAHHLDWDEEDPDPKWSLVQQLSRRSTGLLLLTATPRQHGLCTQFGLLHLVDPQRYPDYEEFLAETETAAETAQIARALESGGELAPGAEQALTKLFAGDSSSLQLLRNISDESARHKLLSRLVDRHGTGYVFFRNRRERLKGFPKRKLISVPLEASSDYRAHLGTVDSSQVSGVQTMDYATARRKKSTYFDRPSADPRLTWLRTLAQEKAGEKILVICSTTLHVNALSRALQDAGMEVGVFHDGLSVVDRDKQAAMFANPDGFQILLSSEIGGEGRNFQFAKKLVIIDLPRHPDLLEQRIGRLDRIGQGREIEIYVPWLRDTPEEALFQWYHQGLNAFEQSWNGADPLLDAFGEELLKVCQSFFPAHGDHAIRQQLLSQLVEDTRAAAERLQHERAEGVDVLLDLNSFDQRVGNDLLATVEDHDDDLALESFLKATFEFYGVQFEELDDRGSIVVDSEELMFMERFPGLPANERIGLTFDRRTALMREDLEFVTYDHRVAKGAVSMFLDRSEGMASICQWPNSPLGRSLLIELSFVMEPKGPAELDLGRFLSVESVEIQLNHLGEVVEEHRHHHDPTLLTECQHSIPPDQLAEQLQVAVDTSLSMAREKCRFQISSAVDRARGILDEELDRLRYLSEVNASVGSGELAHRAEQRDKILEALAATEPRLDAIRIVISD